MRATITIETTATTTEDALQRLAAEWRRITGDSSADLPTDSELFMENSSGEQSTYNVTFTARTKLNATGAANV